MQPQEYFAILPLLIYGIAIAELVSPWRSFFEEKKPYLPFILTGLLMLEVAFSNFYRFFSFLDHTYQNYFVFLAHLFSPLVFLMAAHVYTPEERKNLDTRDYFHRKFKLLMILLAIFVSSHFVYDIGANINTYLRLTFIAILLFAGLTRKVWMVYLLIAIRIFVLTFFTT